MHFIYKQRRSIYHIITLTIIKVNEMASGLVAKKIALFELKPQNFEQQCRLKRKHAIRRKKYRGKERRIVTREGTSMIALSTSDEHLNHLLKDSDEDACSSSSHYNQSCSSQFSASCSALFDLVSVESSESGVTVEDDTTHMEIIPRSKRVVLKSSGSRDKKLSKRLNIIDIDIEITIEQKEQRNASPVSVDAITCGEDEYEPLVGAKNVNGSIKSGTTGAATPPVALTTERIRLKASVDDSTKTTKEKSANYFCSKCSHDTPNPVNDNNNKPIKTDSSKTKENGDKANKVHNCSGNVTNKNDGDSSPEPLYENIFTCVPPPPVSLGAPPLPPKRLFGDSFTTNYSCLPAAHSRERRKTQIIDKGNILSLLNTVENKVSKTIDASCLNKPHSEQSENAESNITPSGKNIADKSSIKATTSIDDSDGIPLSVLKEHVTDHGGGGNQLLLATINAETTTERSSPESSTTTAATVVTETPVCLFKHVDNTESSRVDHDIDDFDNDDDEEPYYEDLYDYCNGSEIGTRNELIDPILELFRDQLNSLEQNVADEVEYCDCSTISAMMNSKMTSDVATNLNDNLRSFYQLNQHQHDTSSLRSYEIYDDCYGLAENASNENVDIREEGKDENNKSNRCDISNDDIDRETKSGNQRKYYNSNTTTPTSKRNSGLATSLILADYIKSKVTKASTPGCWRKVTSSSTGAETGATPNCSYSSSPSTTSASSNLLSMFPTLSASKTNLVAEPKGATNNEQDQELVGESAQTEASSSPQVIVENERNVSKTKNANNESVKTMSSIYSRGMFKNDNGNYTSSSKPRFGGRPVIAHPVEGDNAFHDDNDEEKNNKEGDNADVYQMCQISGEHAHKKNKKDDNEIFNKPLPLPPSNASTYESVYEEPIYGITNQLTATYSDSGNPGGSASNRASPGKRRSSAPAAPPPFLSNKLVNSKPGSIYSHSPSVSSGSTYGYSSGSVNEYGESSSASKYGPSSCQTVASSGSTATPSSSTPTTNSTTPDGMSIYGMSDKLPPTPPSKFSSIAKTAGRKIAKKFLGIRKNSKCGLEEPLSLFNSPNGVGDSSDSGTSQSPPVDLLGSKESNPSVTNYGYGNSGKVAVGGGSQSNHYGGSVGSGGSGGAQIRRPISRPSIPPPEPPKNECSTGTAMPPALPDKANNYSIYSDNKKNDDDYDDSDFYDSDSELIRNFVSQVQPIYSMEEEPLYQYYTYGISLKPDDDYQPVIPKNLGLTLDMLVPRVGLRTLWCELPGVVSSGILSILSDKQKQLQEAIFEILTSEVSYLKSLDVLISLFYKNEELVGVLTEEERGYLFGNIEDVRDCSQAFLSELLGKWEESWYIQEIGEIIARNTETRFSVYKEYCRNKPYQDKTMQKLRHTRDEFVTVVKAIEEDGRCQMLQVDSFLMLPMQRITRLPLLVNAVIQRTAAGKEKCKCEEALKCLTNLVLSCNDAARESQDAEETMAILDKLEFTRGIKALPDLGAFIMKGDFMKNPFDQGRGNQINWTFRKAKRTFYWLLLFSKQLLVARRKANGRFEIIDMIDPIESNIKALPNLEGVSKDFKHFFMLHFSRKETVYFLAARTNSEVERWKSKLDSLKPKEELRVEAIFPYDARRPDEMSFYVGDIIRVSQMQPDGWYFGTKLTTGESGWFPGNYCCENAS